MIRELFEAAQVSEHHVDRHFLADRHHFKVHARTDRVFGVRHGRAQLSALFMRKAFLNLRHHIWRQVIDQVSDLVGIERFNRVDEFVAVHRFDQGLTNALVDFEQNIAVRLTLDLIPDSKTVVKRQGFEYPSNVGRMERLENVTQLLRSFRRQRTRFVILVVLIGLFTAPRFCASGFFGLFTSFFQSSSPILIGIENLLHPRKRAAGFVRIERRSACNLLVGRFCLVLAVHGAVPLSAQGLDGTEGKKFLPDEALRLLQIKTFSRNRP